MLVIHPRGGGRKKYMYGGSGIFDPITSKIFKSGLKGVIKSGAQSAIGQKIADAVVNGATSATKKVLEDSVDSAINKAKSYINNKPLKRKQENKEQSFTPNNKKSKININTLIDGSGIVFD